MKTFKCKNCGEEYSSADPKTELACPYCGAGVRVVKAPSAFTVDLAKKTDEELIREAKATHSAIYVTECYGMSDMLFLELLIGELEKRGYYMKEVFTINFVKEAKEDDEG